MSIHEQNGKVYVLSMPGVVIWNGLTTPDKIEAKDGKPEGQSWNLRLAVDSSAPEMAELNKIVADCFAANKTMLPNAGNHPVSPIDESKWAEHGLSGKVCFSASTRVGAPPVYGADGSELPPAVYGKQIYNGCIVKVLVNCYPYNNKQKGVNFGIEGVQIVDSNAPRIQLGEGGLAKSAIAGIMGGGKAPAAQPAAADVPPTPVDDVPPPPVHTDYMETKPFPPEGWKAHPKSPGWFYEVANATNMKKEAELRALFA